MSESLHSSWSFKIWSTIGVVLHLIFCDIPLDLIRWLSLRQKDVRNQTIVITGGSSGLGRAMSIDFASRGANVAIIDVDEVGGRTLVEEIERTGGVAQFWSCDISKPENVNNVANSIYSTFGNVDIVVCNAAVLCFSSFMEISDQQLRRSFDVNVIGTINTIRGFLGQMEMQNKGQIVCVSSIAGFSGETFGIAYCSTKFAIRGVMESLQMELRDRGLDGINCTTLCPYFARTPMVLNQGMRPTCTWFPFMSIRTCSKGMVDSILKEKVVAFVPSYVTLVPMVKGLLSQNACKSLREYLGIKYVPTVDCNSNRIRITSKMAEYFRSPNVIWYILNAFTIAFCILIWHNPDALDTSYLPWIAYVGNNFHSLLTYLFVLIIGTHMSEALFALYLCHKNAIGFASTAKWVVQTFLLGFLSLRFLLKYSADEHKKRRKDMVEGAQAKQKSQVVKTGVHVQETAQ